MIPKTSPELLDLLAQAAKVRMTPQQVMDQRISFVHGQSGVPKDRVKQILYG